MRVMLSPVLPNPVALCANSASIRSSCVSEIWVTYLHEYREQPTVRASSSPDDAGLPGADDDRCLGVDFLRHRFKRDGATQPAEPPPVELGAQEVRQLETVFTPPRWLRDLGRTSWLLVGLFLLLAGLIWLLGTTNTIVGPLLAAVIVATVAAPVVRQLASHRIPRAAGAAIVVLGAAVLAAVI